MSPSRLRRLLAPVVELRDEECVTALLMFAYSFLAMSGYNVLKPTTRSKFIDDLGANNLPYVQLAAGLLMGFVIQGYTKVMRVLPRRWVFPVTQLTMAAFLVGFWTLFKTGQSWVSVAYYFWGLLAGSLLISQFWTLANDIYEPRQAKRTFGFIGGGASLGGIVGAGLAGRLAKPVGTENLLLIGAAFLLICFFVVWAVVSREQPPDRSGAPESKDNTDKKREAVSAAEGLRLLLHSRHLQIIALVISFAAVGAGIIEQQLNMAAGQLIPLKDARTAFIADVIFYSSIVGLVIQMTLTARMHRVLGIGFALLILPFSLGTTAIVMLLNPVLWATTVARVSDTALRYTADKTTREILFMPLPTELKYKAKPFVDVAVDRFAKGAGAALALLIAIKVFHLTWWQLSYLSLPISALWVVLAIKAKHEYQKTFRQSIERHDIDADAVGVTVADSTTVETLIEELASPDDRRVLYAIDLLDSLDKRNLVTPLLLHHESLRVRVRALNAMAAMNDARPDLAQRWLPSIERLLTDEDPEVRTAAVRTLATLRREGAAEFMRPYLTDRDPRLVITAAVALADSADAADQSAAQRAIETLAEDPRGSSSEIRREVARSLSAIRNPQFRNLLVPLIYDANVDVALAAIRSAGALGSAQAADVPPVIFVPPLVSLLRNRALKAAAREVLVAYGEPILEVLAHFLRDAEEDLWVRRHIPATLARIPSQASVDLLVERLADSDGFLRYKVIAALETLLRARPDLKCARGPVEALAVQEALRSCMYLSLLANLRRADSDIASRQLARALQDKLDRSKDRIYRLLGLGYGAKDMAAARWALERGERRAKSSAAEFLDNLLKGDVRKRVMPLLEDLPVDERVRKANVLIKSRPRDLEDTVTQLVHDDDQVVAAAAIHFVEARKIGALAGDLEHTLEHRDIRDWYVFEAASWALASQRMSAEERRARWMEPLPAVEVVDRLRHVPLFAFVSIDELYRIVAAGHQVRYESGRRIDEPGGGAMLRFLIDGRVVPRTADRTSATEVAAPAVFGFETLVAAAASGDSLVATDTTIVLALPTEEFLTLLSANTQLAAGLFRMLIARAPASPVVHARAAAGPPIAAPGRLRAVDKVLALEAVPVFARASAEELIALAAIAREVPVTDGADLLTQGEPAAIHIVLDGSVQVQANDGSAVTAGPGDTIGIVETLGGGLAEARARGVAPGSALRIDRDALFDVLSDRIDLLRGLFAAMNG
ncbi:MAG: MFS transporter [Acidobacteria bacterium]|nr:MFS transporter [Acidobacteriota bacterium]